MSDKKGKSKSDKKSGPAMKKFNIDKELKDKLKDYKSNKTQTVIFKDVEIKVMQGKKSDSNFLQPCPEDVNTLVTVKGGKISDLEKQWEKLLENQLLSSLNNDDDDDDIEIDDDMGRQKKSKTGKKVIKASKTCSDDKPKKKSNSKSNSKSLKRTTKPTKGKSKGKSKSKSANKKTKSNSKSAKSVKPKKVTKK